MKRLILIFVLTSFTLTLSAQLSRTMHQVFEIDSVGMVNVNLWAENDNYKWEAESWPSRHIMVETNVGLTNANDAILEFLMEEKRYELKIEKEPDLVTLTNVLEERTPIGTKKGDISEEIELIIYIPEFFIRVDDTTWKREPPAKKSENE